ncbi:MAG: WD40 repeat domain-containing protein [Acidobacteriaceae bacterium]|nr:WD40 repeat domain-containing protein [Acidobacteriaceae bacterium]
MDAKRLKKLQQQLYSQTSLIGEWQQRLAVALLVRDGSPEAQDALCLAVIEHDHPLAREAALSVGHAPREAGTRALFFFLTEQWEKYNSLDFDQSLLRAAYAAADEALRKRIADQARRAGRVEWVGVVTGGAFLTMDGGRHLLRMGEMTDAEWETTLAVLRSGQRGEEMWRLAQVAPPLWSERLLRQIRQAMWCIGEAERDGFEELVRLAETCDTEASDKLGGLVRCRATLEGHRDKVTCLGLSADGRLLSSGGWDNTVRLWRLPEGTLLKALQGHSCPTLSADGRLLASGSGDNTVRLWRLPEGTLLKTLKGHTNFVRCLSLSADGRLLASSSRDNTVRLWRLPEGTLLKTLKGHTSFVSGLTLSADGRLLASGSYDNTVRLWDLTLCLLTRLPVTQTTLDDLAWAQNALRDDKITAGERAWLEFMEALMRWRRRFDIDIADAPSRIDVGEFDIEIEG